MKKKKHNWKRCCHGRTKYRKKEIDVEKLSLINLRTKREILWEIPSFEYSSILSPWKRFFKNYGRKWTDKLFPFPQSHTSGCEFLKVPCLHPECSTLMKKADLKQHLERYCMYRPQKCEFCAREIPLTNLKVSNILFCLFIIYNTSFGYL